MTAKSQSYHLEGDQIVTDQDDVCWRVKKDDLAPLLELKAAQCSAQNFNAPDTGQF